MSNFYTEQELKSLGLKQFGKNVLISKKASIYGAGRISIGDYSRVDDFCIISAGEGEIIIGKFVHIACYTSVIGAARIEIDDFAGISSHSSVYSSSDDYSGAFLTNPTVFLPKYKKLDNRPVKISRHVIIGAGSCVLPGVCIGEGSAIGAISLVTKNIEPGVIATGSPCKEIKKRKNDIFELEKKFLQEAGY